MSWCGVVCNGILSYLFLVVLKLLYITLHIARLPLGSVCASDAHTCRLRIERCLAVSIETWTCNAIHMWNESSHN
jgi:hypothetical protein